MKSSAPVEFLKSKGTHEADHDTGVKFLEHLQGVQRVLEGWGEPNAVSLAGLFHSIYGTELFQDYSVSFDRRPEIRNIIGERAEATVHTFCIMNLASLDATLDVPAGQHSVVAHKQHGGHRIPLTDQQFRDLIVVQLADWLEQVERYSHMPDPKLGWQPGDAWGHRRTGYKKMAHMLGGQPLAAWEATYSREPKWTRHICNDITPEFIQYKTVSNPDTASHALEKEQFTKAHKFLQRSYPSVYKQLKAEKINDLSLLFTWRGKQPQLDPVLLVAHLDVVPADDSPGSPWSHPPFGGEIDEGYIWGRGAMDIKFVVTATLEAVSELLGRGFQPERTVHLAFGHDEEVGGDQGAAKIAQLLESRGVRLDILLDEGGLIAVDGLSPLTNAKIALVGTAEKGYESVTVEMTGRGGHSSMPPIDKQGKGLQVPARLAKLMHAVESQPPPIMMTDPMPAFIHAVTPTCPIPVLRWLLGLAQRWPTLLAHLLAKKGPDTAALMRTTAAVTYLHAHTADNVLPSSGQVGFNFRLLPGHIPGEYAYQYLQQRLGADMEHAKLRPSNDEPATAASAVSSCTSRRFKLVERALQETMGQDEQGLVVAPFLLVGATDSRHYPNITAGGTHVYRFNALEASLKQKDIRRVHGVDERIEVKGYLQAIQFYVRFLELATLADAT